jgi:hypothetical protein
MLSACQQPNSSGLTKEQAEAVLRERGYTYPTLGPAPDGLFRLCGGARISNEPDGWKGRYRYIQAPITMRRNITLGQVARSTE